MTAFPFTANASKLDALTWPASRLGEAIDALARKSGFAPRSSEALPSPAPESLVRNDGEVLGRIPAGLLQMVGEMGWQLSHGEKSRLYIARALLQNAELIGLDESFAALDPENLQRALHCVLDRTSTVLVIAHP